MSQVEELLTIAVKAIDAASARHVGHTRSRLTPPTDNSILARSPGGASSRGNCS